MTPKTAIEKEITALSRSLAPISPAVHTWAEKTVFLKWGVLSRGRFHCLDCMHSWKPDSAKPCDKFIKCTACGGKLKMFGYNQVHFKEIEYSAVLDTCGGYQLVRIICSHKQMKKNFLPTFFHKEVMQHWINPKGEVRTLSLSCNVFSQSYDSWKYYSDLEIRPKDFQNNQKFRINPYRVYPRAKVLPALKRNGFKTAFHNIAPQILFSSLLKDSIAETLLKALQASILSYYLSSHSQQIRQNWQAVKTCLKSGYKIPDLKIWEDYIALLRWFKKDLCSPLLVCPEDLNKAHDRLVTKKRALQRRKHLEKMRSEILKAQEIYLQEKKQYFGLCFKEKNLTISVLENVQDFMQEGDDLHHCVFTNEYYQKKDSLLFSAKIDGVGIETVEVSLSHMEILQSRGIGNKFSRHHKQILALMNKSLCQIQARKKTKKTVLLSL
ncbi:PcfJ domain-containing protein [Flavobacterium mesophilum]|uniref:PcfJ domain-containing protein n=1 Tax=Flavobacterium mesophilum TaxID=3143495 RepID=UPI0031CFFEF6